MNIAERKIYQEARRKAELDRASGYSTRAGLHMIFEALKSSKPKA